MTTVDTTPKKILDKLNAGIEISNVDFDIRNLSSATDSVEVKQATATNLKANVTIAASQTIAVTNATAANLNAAVVNAAGTGLTNLGYGSSDGGTNWYPNKTGTDGVQQVSQSSTKTHNVYTFNEWLMENGTLIKAAASVSEGTSAIYTVPANKILYLTSLTISASMLGAGTGTCSIKFDTTIVLGLYLQASSGQDANQVTTSNPTIPLKLTAGTAINVYSPAATIGVYGSIFGYLVSA